MFLQRWDTQIHSCRECVTIASNTWLCCSQGRLLDFFSQISHVSSSAPHWARILLCWWQTESWMELPVGLMRQTSVYMASARWSNFLLFYFWCQVQPGAAPCGWLGGCPWGEGTALFYRALYKCSMALCIGLRIWMPEVGYYSWTAGNAQKSHLLVCMAWVGRDFCEGSRWEGKSGLLNCSFLAMRGITDESTEAANQLTNCH